MNTVVMMDATVPRSAFDFANDEWRQFPSKKHAELRLASCELWWNPATKAGALVARRATKYPEYPISKAGLDYLSDAVQAGTVSEGLVVLAGWEGPQRVPLKIMPVTEVVEVLKDVTPREGPYGPYWWLEPDGRPYDQNSVPF